MVVLRVYDRIYKVLGELCILNTENIDTNYIQELGKQILRVLANVEDSRKEEYQ